MGKGGKKRGGGGGKGKHHKGGGGGNTRRKKDNSPVATTRKVAGKTFPVSGLMNLGNTCFFNSVMQCIAQTDQLRLGLNAIMRCPQYSLRLTDGTHQLQVEVTEAPRELTKTLHTFLGEMTVYPGRTLNPRPLFSQICDKAPRFRGFQQQDSQELLRYLLDSLKTAEIYRIKKAILDTFNVTGGKKTKPTERDRDLIKIFGSVAYRTLTYVDEVFGGFLVSTITCNECHNCTVLQESYLDLSLSIPRDKGVQSSRDKGRRNTHTSEGDTEGREGQGEQMKQNSVESAVMSKHQMKKAMKKARKSKAVKRPLHELDDMLSERDGKREKDDNPADDVKENAEDGTVDGMKEGENLAPEKSNLEQNESHLVQELANLGLGEANSGQEHMNAVQKQLNLVQEEVNLGQERVNSGQDQLNSGQEDVNLGQEPVDSEQDHVQKQLNSTTHSDPFGTNLKVGPSGDAQCEETNDAELLEETTPTVGETCSPLTSVDCDEDSIEGCLKRFCSAEVLTGSNRIYCATCTERKKTLTGRSEIVGEIETEGSGAVNPESERACDGPSLALPSDLLTASNCNSKQDDDQAESYEGGEDIVLLTDPSEGVKVLDNDKSSVVLEGMCDGEVGEEGKEEVKSESESLADSRTASHTESCKESDDEMLDTSTSELHASLDKRDETKKADSAKEDQVFCDARKQLLLKSVPPVLTLHLKRFLQEGRRLRKNGRHIVFPDLLDVAPYCVTNCKSLCGRCGRILYSLYAVVEHAGGMQGGHYTAYVRARKTDNHTPLITVGGASSSVSEVGQQEVGVVSSSVGVATDSETVMTSDGQRETTCSDQNHCVTTGDHSSTNGDHTTSTANQTSAMPDKTDAKRDQQTALTELDHTTTKPDKNSTTKAQTRSKKAPPSPTKLEFDLSSTGGQWYNVSDTNVRTATEREVHKSQAYILFYERLPFKSS